MQKKTKKALLNEKKILHSAIKLFISSGYVNTTLRGIAKECDLTTSSVYNIFESKEKIVSVLINYVIQFQTNLIEENLTTNDLLIKYMSERVLQIYLSESNKFLSEMYIVSYTLPMSAEIIYEKITDEIIKIFKDRLPQLSISDFYEKEIAVAGIMRGFLSVPCDRYFTLRKKMKAFIRNSLFVLEVDKVKIEEVVNEVLKIDFENITLNLEEKLITFIDEKIYDNLEE